MACTRPLHVVLPACATDKIALPPAPVSAKYTAVFEVEFVNASPDTKIDLALAMRVDGHALLRNVQEVEADARRCVRLQVEVEVPKGHTASLSWRPFSRKPERLPAWLTIGRGEARMAISAPPQPPAQPQQHPQVAAAPAPPTHNQGSAHANHNKNNDDNNSVVTNEDSATHLVSGDGDAGRRNKHRDRRRARETTRDDKPSRHRRHRRSDGVDGDRRAKEDEASTDGATEDARDRDVRDKHERRDRNDRHGRRDTKKRDRHRHDRERERDQQSASRDATTAAVATALAAVAAARNAHDDEDEEDEEDSVYCGDSESVSMLPVPPAMGMAPHHQARMLVPITAMGHRLAARRY
ncbi:hypothetical protein pdul_cds_221 [Pandoravirus dulcis]|uniref:Uncharacterized protein n=1 Tax=Pandoravirus dulcis TaxID=1349409 RepID=S4VPH1_9VIRU|nr:hypothetical protein pdul_cds_221 [Pandoravirus dulcis]AGO82167.1 hypothetical protein pdul_cds_221 [Pandoravirus dulcis]